MKDKCLKITSGTCLCFWLVILIFSVALIEPLIIGFVRENAAMLPQTEGLWGQVPGDTGTEVIRNFTFYNFTNPYGYLFRGQIPKFVEESGFAIQQLSSMLDRKYNDDMSEVKFNYWLHFENLTKSRNLNQKVNILNIAPLGFWNQLNSINSSTFTIQGMGPLFIQLNKTLKTQAIGQGIKQQFLPDYKTTLNYCKKCSLSNEQCDQIYKDPINGLYDGNNYEVWVQASLLEDKNSRNYLYSYFPFDRVAMNSFLDLMASWAQTLNMIINNWYCEGRNCNAAELTAKQLSRAGVTSNPPAGTEPSDTFCSENSTCEGYPQISAFVKHVMHKPFKNLTFTEDNFKYLLTPGKGLLHIGNLNRLWQWGHHFEEEGHPKDAPAPSYYLFKIQELFHLQSQEHAYVFWCWIKYFTNQFVLRKSQGGSGKVAGFGGLVSASIYEAFTQFGDWIIPELRSYFTYLEVGNCENYLFQYFPSFPKQIIKNKCSRVDQSNYRTYMILLNPCIDNEDDIINGTRLDQYCDSEVPRSMKGILNKIDRQIKQQYDCSGKRCSNYQLSLMQFVNSTVTLNPPRDYRAQTLTAKDWNKNLDHFEYQYFVQQVKGQKFEHINLNESALRDLMSFDKLWSAPMMGKFWLLNDEQFIETFYWKNHSMFKEYIRYMLLEVGFGGFTQERSAAELIYGYEDPFITKLVQLDPLMGGDPSVPTKVAFNQPNVPKEQAYLTPVKLNTGYIDPDQVRKYLEVYNLDYIAYNRTWFDGDRVGWTMQNPWKQKILFNGTDSIQNKPAFTQQDKVSVYLSTIFRGGQLIYNRTVQRFGLDLFEMKTDEYMLASEEQYEYNSNFYQTFNGFLNLSYQGLPMFISKNHFYNAPENWTQLVQYYDKHNNKQEANSYDDIILLLEPYSGASFIATIFLQSNYYSTPDVLFQRDRRMLPIFSLYRSGNISDSAVEQYFGPLKTIIWLKRMLFVIAIICIFLIVVVYAGCQVHKKNKLKQSAMRDPSLLESVPHD